MVDTDVVTSGEIGFDEKEIGLMILGNYYAIIVTIFRAKENWAIWGLCNVVFWGLRAPPMVRDGGYRCCDHW